MGNFQDAVSFLTVIPMPCPLTGSDDSEITSGAASFSRSHPAARMRRALGWFPAVGALIGGAGAFLIQCSAGWWTTSVASLLGLIFMVVLTGGLHLDGFSDTVDGLGCWKGPEETLKVMKDSRIGALGAAALTLLLLLKWAAIQAIPAHRLLPGLVLACGLSRWGMVISAQMLPYVPGKSGLGKIVTEKGLAGPAAFATLFSVALALACVGPLWALVSIGTALGLVLGLNRLFLVRLGGITGDALGAVNESVEAGLLLLLVMSG